MKLRNFLSMIVMAFVVTFISCDGTAQEVTTSPSETEASINKVREDAMQKADITEPTQKGDIETAREIEAGTFSPKSTKEIEQSRKGAINKLGSIGEPSEDSDVTKEAREVQAQQQAQIKQQRETTIHRRVGDH